MRKRSIEEVERSESLTAHAQIILGAMDTIHHFVLQRFSDDPDVLTLQHLGIRLFNGLAVAVNSATTGYYQACTAQLRDILETSFLMDLFGRDRAAITEWRTLDKKAKWKKFSPVRVRTELDRLDGFTSLKRAAAYELLNDLGAHPSTLGFQMTQAGEHGAHCGPFFEASKFDASWAELAKLALQAAGSFSLLFEAESLRDGAVKIEFLETHSKWLERFFGVTHDQQAIAKLRAAFQLRVESDK